MAGGRELQSLRFPGHRRQRMTWLIFVSLKQRSKLSSQVHTTHHHVRGTCFSGGHAWPQSSHLPFQRGCHSIILPPVSLYPLDLQSWRGKGAVKLVRGRGKGGDLPRRKKALTLNRGAGGWSQRPGPEGACCPTWILFIFFYPIGNCKKDYFMLPEANQRRSQMTRWLLWQLP